VRRVRWFNNHRHFFSYIPLSPLIFGAIEWTRVLVPELRKDYGISAKTAGMTLVQTRPHIDSPRRLYIIVRRVGTTTYIFIT
jgi:hypothetical protein